jgi:hypothetical protein
VGAKLFGIAVAVMSLRDDRRIDAQGDFKLVEQAQEALSGLLPRAAMTWEERIPSLGGNKPSIIANL